MGSAVLHWFAVRSIHGPWIVPDEMIYADRAVTVWRRGPGPLLHGPGAGYGLLYPLVAGVPLSLGRTTQAYSLLKIVQPVVMSLAVVPVFLFGRRLMPARWALVAAALTAASPLLLYSGFVMTEVLSEAKTHGLDATFPVDAKQVIEILDLVDAATISGKQSKELYALVKGTHESPAAVAKSKGMAQVSDASVLEDACKRVVAANPKQAQAYRSGKTGMIGFFVGQVMKETKGSANPALVNEILKKILEAP